MQDKRLSKPEFPGGGMLDKPDGPGPAPWPAEVEATVPPAKPLYWFPDEIWIGYDSTPGAVSRDDSARNYLFHNQDDAARWAKADTQHRFIAAIPIRPSVVVYRVEAVPATHRLKAVT